MTQVVEQEDQGDGFKSHRVLSYSETSWELGTNRLISLTLLEFRLWRNVGFKKGGAELYVIPYNHYVTISNSKDHLSANCSKSLMINHQNQFITVQDEVKIENEN